MKPTVFSEFSAEIGHGFLSEFAARFSGLKDACFFPGKI